MQSAPLTLLRPSEMTESLVCLTSNSFFEIINNLAYAKYESQKLSKIHGGEKLNGMKARITAPLDSFSEKVS